MGKLAGVFPRAAAWYPLRVPHKVLPALKSPLLPMMRTSPRLPRMKMSPLLPTTKMSPRIPTMSPRLLKTAIPQSLIPLHRHSLAQMMMANSSARCLVANASTTMFFATLIYLILQISLPSSDLVTARWQNALRLVRTQMLSSNTRCAKALCTWAILRAKRIAFSSLAQMLTTPCPSQAWLSPS